MTGVEEGYKCVCVVVEKGIGSGGMNGYTSLLNYKTIALFLSSPLDDSSVHLESCSELQNA